MENKTIGKFDIENKSFDKDYASKAQHRQSLNEKIIENLSNSITERFTNNKQSPTEILDLCYGHGKPTYELLTSLLQKGRSVKQIVRYDISEDQIDNAKDAYSDIPELNFYVQNVEEMTNTRELDLMITLFGLHWV